MQKIYFQVPCTHKKGLSWLENEIYFYSISLGSSKIYLLHIIYFSSLLLSLSSRQGWDGTTMFSNIHNPHVSWRLRIAHTGEISAAVLKDAGASHVILGHSERRTDHGEASELVRRKLAAAHAAGLVAVVCVGETLAERETGEKLPVLARQLADSLGDAISPDYTVIAYEPVWAIGTGKTPTPDEVAEVHAFIRRTLAERFGEALAGGIRILYGGSVQPGNAATLLALPDVDGALVGGASLKAKDFLAICEAARNCR